jgi:hypothetical protein
MNDQYSLPEFVGAMFDSTVLAGDAIRVVADTWCRRALDGLHRAGRVVRPLRDAAERARAAARAAAALEEGDADERLTTRLYRQLTRSLVLAPLQTSIVNRSSGCCGGVPHPRGHNFALRMPGAGFLHILPGFPVGQKESGNAGYCSTSRLSHYQQQCVFKVMTYQGPKNQSAPLALHRARRHRVQAKSQRACLANAGSAGRGASFFSFFSIARLKLEKGRRPTGQRMRR